MPWRQRFRLHLGLRWHLRSQVEMNYIMMLAMFRDIWPHLPCVCCGCNCDEEYSIRHINIDAWASTAKTGQVNPGGPVQRSACLLAAEEYCQTDLSLCGDDSNMSRVNYTSSAQNKMAYGTLTLYWQKKQFGLKKQYIVRDSFVLSTSDHWPEASESLCCWF